MSKSLWWQVSMIVVVFFSVTMTAVGAEKVGPNLIPNSSFESVVDGKAENIDLTFQQGKPTIEVDTTVARSGANSMRITCASNERGAVTKRVLLTGGKIYRLSAWYKTSPGVKPAGVTIRLMFFTSPTSSNNADKVALTKEMLFTEGAFRLGIDNFVDATQDAAHEWRQLQMIVQVPANVVSVHFQVFAWYANGTVWVDDIAVEELALSTGSLNGSPGQIPN